MLVINLKAKDISWVFIVLLMFIYHWWIQGVATGACPPPNWIHFFHFHRKVPMLEVSAPQWFGTPPPMRNPESATVYDECSSN